jgi:hypothetical protein
MARTTSQRSASATPVANDTIRPVRERAIPKLGDRATGQITFRVGLDESDTGLMPMEEHRAFFVPTSPRAVGRLRAQETSQRGAP